jgi:type IV secretion system protein VirB10
MTTRENGEEVMRVFEAASAAAIVLGLGIAATGLGLAQAPAQPEAAPSSPAQPPAASSSPANQPPNASAAVPFSAPATEASPAAPEKKIYTVPAGTKVLLQLRSAINTKSAKPGDGVYLASAFPVVVGNRVMIPAGVYVQGVVDRVERAGRMNGRAQLDMHFTSIIFPNGTVVEIPGIVNSLPGAKKQSVKDDGEGTIEQAGDKGRNAGQVAQIAIPTGGTVGTIGGLGAGHPIAGGVAGIGAGLAAVGLATLFTRGADVNIEGGSQVEMVLQRPLVLEEENLGGVNSPGPAPNLVPAANQPKPLEKPNRTRVLCPLGGLACE